MTQSKPRHECRREGWQDCTACAGRVHEPGCTSKRDPSIDCCKRRHQLLYECGHKVGLCDSSVPMLAGYDNLDS
jgi:hypothetical protein